ncbi:DUF5010 domain-containing protein [Andreprevotia chitinilytica]|uniref:DUF5010 domain-containing protein n=1 Tax=Andreprevotia chitinilytica TaxID=396808 RepID=UPI00055934DB|nr:DUF5010 domain-containing protein [Andreprevotia chitinilytica]
MHPPFRQAAGLAAMLLCAAYAYAAYPAWQPDTYYAAGSVVSYNGRDYKAIVNQTDYSSTGWNPTVSSLWQDLGASSGATATPAPTPTPAPTSISTGVQAHYLGATFGYNYTNNNDMIGPDTGTQNTPLYNPDPNNPDLTWDTWVREAGQAGLDFLAPNARGASPDAAWSPATMAPVLTALNNSGFASSIKIALFDDNASSWQGQWNRAGHTGPFDIGNAANWTYIYDTNYKIFFQTIPDANRFKINGRPVIMIWTGNSATVGNEQGNYSRAMTYVRQKCQADFGFDPYIIVNEDALKNDSTLAAVVDGAHSWSNGGTWSLTTFNGTKVGVAFPGLYASTSSGFRDPNHGQTLKTALENTVKAGALLTLIEGFTDWEEDAAIFRVRNLDTNGNPLGYSQTLYDYPNQRLDIVRMYSQNPFPASLKFEAAGADQFGGAAGGNGKVNFYRNGNIAIEPSSDTGGGFNVGWMQRGEWIEWESVPFNGTPHFMVRIATPNTGMTAHLVIDGVAQARKTLPNTGGWQTWATFDLGTYGTYSNSYHTVRLVFDSGNVNVNWWEVQQ